MGASPKGQGWKGCVKTTQPHSRNLFHQVTVPKAPVAPPAPAAAPRGPWHAPGVPRGADTAHPSQSPRGGCALIPRAAARPRPAPLVVLRGNRKSLEEHRAPLLPGSGELLPQMGNRDCCCQQGTGPGVPTGHPSALPSPPVAAPVPAWHRWPCQASWSWGARGRTRGVTKWRMGHEHWVLPRLRGTGRAARPRSAGKDLAPLGSLLTAAFRGFPLHAPLPGPRPSFPSGSCPYWSLNSITPTPPPCLVAATVLHHKEPRSHRSLLALSPQVPAAGAGHPWGIIPPLQGDKVQLRGDSQPHKAGWKHAWFSPFFGKALGFFVGTEQRTPLPLSAVHQTAS